MPPLARPPPLLPLPRRLGAAALAASVCACVPGHVAGTDHAPQAQAGAPEQQSPPFDHALLAAARDSISTLGKYSGENRASAEALALISFLDSPSPSAADELTAAFPDSAYLIDVEKAVADLQRRELGESGWWETYLAKYPQGFYRREAELLAAGAKFARESSMPAEDAKRLTDAQALLDTDPGTVRHQFKAVLVLGDAIYLHPKQRTPFYLEPGRTDIGTIAAFSNFAKEGGEKACGLVQKNIPNVDSCLRYGAGMALEYQPVGVSLATFTAAALRAGFGGLVGNDVPTDTARMFELAEQVRTTAGAFSGGATVREMQGFYDEIRFKKMRRYWGKTTSVGEIESVPRIDLQGSLMWSPMLTDEPVSASESRGVCMPPAKSTAPRSAPKTSSAVPPTRTPRRAACAAQARACSSGSMPPCERPFVRRMTSSSGAPSPTSVPCPIAAVAHLRRYRLRRSSASRRRPRPQ